MKHLMMTVVVIFLAGCAGMGSSGSRSDSSGYGMSGTGSSGTGDKQENNIFHPYLN